LDSERLGFLLFSVLLHSLKEVLEVQILLAVFSFVSDRERFLDIVEKTGIVLFIRFRHGEAARVKEFVETVFLEIVVVGFDLRMGFKSRRAVETLVFEASNVIPNVSEGDSDTQTIPAIVAKVSGCAKVPVMNLVDVESGSIEFAQIALMERVHFVSITSLKLLYRPRNPTGGLWMFPRSLSSLDTYSPNRPLDSRMRS